MAAPRGFAPRPVLPALGFQDRGTTVMRRSREIEILRQDSIAKLTKNPLSAVSVVRGAPAPSRYFQRAPRFESMLAV